MKKLLILLIAVVSISTAKAQFSSVRTNGLMWLTGTINAGIDIRVHNKLSVDALVFFNPIKTPAFSIQAIGIQPALRYWLYETGVGPFFSAHGTFAGYYVGDAVQNYQGFLAGVGLSFGYNWLLTKRWSMGFELGMSALFMKDARRDNETHYTQDEYIDWNSRWVAAPTKAEISFIYLF